MNFYYYYIQFIIWDNYIILYYFCIVKFLKYLCNIQQKL